MNLKSRRGVLFTAILWTIVSITWGIMIVTRYNDPGTNGESLVLTICTMLLSMALCVIFWVRFARYGKK